MFHFVFVRYTQIFFIVCLFSTFHFVKSYMYEINITKILYFIEDKNEKSTDKSQI